nr:alpha-crystallin A chain [Helicoverpa armigera]
MFSPRLFAVLAILATAAAVPATDRPVPKPVTTITDDDISEPYDNPWFSFPLFGNLFAPLWKLFPTFADIGPRITADDDKFQVVVNVKDFKKENLKVKVDGGFIFVQGSHEAKQDDHDIFASQFFHTYALPVNSSSADVTAELTSDGNLVVTAPITNSNEKSSKVDREVTIVETGKPFKPEEIEKATTLPPATTVAEDEERKEPTTPSEGKEEVTEKDNVIPHGSDAAV